MHEVRLRDGVTIFPGFICGEDYQLPLCSCTVALLGEQSTGGFVLLQGISSAGLDQPSLLLWLFRMKVIPIAVPCTHWG